MPRSFFLLYNKVIYAPSFMPKQHLSFSKQRYCIFHRNSLLQLGDQLSMDAGKVMGGGGRLHFRVPPPRATLLALFPSICASRPVSLCASEIKQWTLLFTFSLKILLMFSFFSLYIPFHLGCSLLLCTPPEPETFSSFLTSLSPAAALS